MTRFHRQAVWPLGCLSSIEVLAATMPLTLELDCCELVSGAPVCDPRNLKNRAF
jgi:hypothetical protein